MISDYFLDMTGVETLIIPLNLKNELQSALNLGIEESVERGGYITVKKEGSICYAKRVIELPKQFREPNSLLMGEVHNSRWAKFQVPRLFLNGLINGSKIVFEWHTHATLQFEPCYSHEAKKTERKSNFLGDLILEMGLKNQIFQYSFVKSPNLNYFRIDCEEGIVRKVSRVNIKVK